tara:strand:- start:1117 stop:1989 length:873 start_codon:yes stop_codon:yes gene_type:complete
MNKNHYKNHRDFLDILRGYNKFNFLNKEYYFRHFSLEQTLEMDALMEIDVARSVKRGVKKQEVLLSDAMEMGSWSQQKEDQIKSLEWMIKKSTVALGKMQDLKQREVFNSQIEKQREELASIGEARRKIIAYSAENLAQTKKVNRMLESSLFCDEEFKEKVSEDLRLALAPLMFATYASFTDRDNLLMCSYHSGFLDLFATQYRNPIALFGKTMAELTVFQRGLMIITHSLLNKIKHVKIPEELSGDPIKIYEYEEEEQTDKTVSHGLDDLKAKTKVRGGKLKPEDFLSG